MEKVPDSAKVLGATGSTTLTLMGVPVEQWMYVASAIVSVLFIIEKMPITIQRCKQFINWVKGLRNERKK